MVEKHEIVRYPSWMEDEVKNITKLRQGDGSIIISVSVPPIEKEREMKAQENYGIFLKREAYLRYLQGYEVRLKDEIIAARPKEDIEAGFERIFESRVFKVAALVAPKKKEEETKKKEVIKKKRAYKIPEVLGIEYTRLPWEFLCIKDIFLDSKITYTSKGWRVAIGHGMDLDVLLFNENKFEGYIEVYAQTSLKADYDHDVFRISGYRCRYLCDEDGNIISRAFVIDPPIGSSID